MTRASLKTCPLKASCDSCLWMDTERGACALVSLVSLLELGTSINQDIAHFDEHHDTHTRRNDFNDYPGVGQP